MLPNTPGCYTASPASDEPHRAGGDDKDAVVLFSIRNNCGTCYELLDDHGEIVSALGFDDFKNIYAAPSIANNPED